MSNQACPHCQGRGFVHSSYGGIYGCVCKTPENAPKIDTTNRYCVSMLGDDIVIRFPVRQLRREEALNLAAWLVAMADDKDEFAAILAAVQNA